MKQVDIAVIGAGSAGVATAIAVAESGLSVVLIDANTMLGGLASAAMVGTVCGLFYRDPHQARYAVKGFAHQFAVELAGMSLTKPHCFAQGLHFLPYQIKAFHRLSLQLLQRAEVQLYLNTELLSVDVVNGQVTQLLLKTAQQEFNIQPLAVIDCSGQAVVSQLANLERLIESQYQTASFVFQVQGLPSMEPRMLSLNLIRWLQVGIDQGELEPECAYLSLMVDTVQQGQGLFKLGLPSPTEHRANYVDIYKPIAICRSKKVVRYLTQAVPLLSQLDIVVMATQLGIRSSAKSKGLELLDQQQVLACAKPDNGIAVGAWPIEQWQQQAKPTMQYFSENDCYWIPAGALVSDQLSNLFFAGRTFSATESAMASARVIGTCLSTGYAAGLLASAWVKTGHWQTAIQKIQLKQVFTKE